jgi:hypothetical protein
MKVRERKAKDAWASYCLERETDEISKVKSVKVREEEEQREPRFSAPFFGPARKLGETTQQISMKKSIENPWNSSRHLNTP